MHEKIIEQYVNRARCFLERLPEYFFAEQRPLTLEYWNSGQEIVPFDERRRGDYRRISEGEDWGRDWDSAWFHAVCQVPRAWRGKEVVCRLNFGGEALLFDREGVPSYAFCTSSIFSNTFSRQVYPAIRQARGGERLDLWIEAAANQLFGLYMNESPALDEPHVKGAFQGNVKLARAAVFRRDVWQLSLDFEVLLSLLDSIPADDYRRNRLLDVLNRAVNAFADDPDRAEDARRVLRDHHVPAWTDAMHVMAVGHAHIDTGWLWRVRETVRKCARTYANQLYNIDHYPGYVFGASQPQQYFFVKTHYPKLYERVKKAVAAGRWELQGGMWVECDCNLTSGESLVRQFLHGKNFFRDEFGVDVRNVWIPDVFGYSAAMPQICRLAGCDALVTQKISWNQFNRFPYNSFIWEGIDGSTLLTHFPPEDNYLSELAPAPLVAAQNRYAENAISDEFLSLFGMGDGGGGPKQNHLERGLRMADLGGCPKVRFGKAQDFLDRLQKLAPSLPRWTGELYLEQHRGTYTTQGRIKKNNRRLEQLLQAVEFFLAGRGRALSATERQSLDSAWKKLLINQFHDILPGSSIGAVYEDTLKEYDEIAQACRSLLPAPPTAAEQTATVCNTLSCAWRGLVRLPCWAGASGSSIVAQSPDGDGVEVLVELPPLGCAVLHAAPQGRVRRIAVDDKSLVLENALVRYEFTADGVLAAAYDKQLGRALMRPGQRGNVVSLYVDRPVAHEAWDVDIYYREGKIGEARAAGVPVKENRPTASRLHFPLAIGGTAIQLTVELRPGEKLLRFEQRLDWHENRRLLRVAFEADVEAPEARCDIQYGYVRRATHRNTSWEQAKFEVPIQRYADLTDSFGGFALLNDSKYGIAISPSCLDLALLRSPKYPDWKADMGEHSYRYAFLPHEAATPVSAIAEAAAAFNREPLAFAGEIAWQLPCRLVAEHVSLEVAKPAEKSDDLILRLVETGGGQASAVLEVAPGWTLAVCDLLEWETGTSVRLAHGQASLAFRPFEIMTLRLHQQGKRRSGK